MAGYGPRPTGAGLSSHALMCESGASTFGSGAPLASAAFR